jgi:hypothetical protein
MIEINQVTEVIIGAAIVVHRALGPGLLSRPTHRAWSTNYVSEGFSSSLRSLCP